jgi:hypothetical protein
MPRHLPPGSVERYDEPRQCHLDGVQADDPSTDPAISSDGRRAVFFSATDLVADDTNSCPPFFVGHPGQCPDIYLHTR